MLAKRPPFPYSRRMCFRSIIVWALAATGAACLSVGADLGATPTLTSIRIEQAERAPATPSETATEFIQAAVAADIQRTTALVAADTRALELICGDELIFGHADGRIQTKSELLGSLTAGEMHYFAINPGPREVRILGEAVALVFGSAELLVGNAEDSQPLKIRYLAVYRFDARLGWRLTAYQSTQRTAEE